HDGISLDGHSAYSINERLRMAESVLSDNTATFYAPHAPSHATTDYDSTVHQSEMPAGIDNNGDGDGEGEGGEEVLVPVIGVQYPIGIPLQRKRQLDPSS